MKHRTILRFFAGALFFALLILSIWVASRMMQRKESLTRVGPFISRADEFDVLFIGDSHMVNDVFPLELWRDYGIASYNISSYGNTLPVSYWAMMNALDYASPKLMVIGVKDVEKGYKLSGSSSDVHTALDGYPLSLTKIRAIEDLMDDPYAVDDSGNSYVDLKWEYYFTLAKYHSRWEEAGISELFYTPNVHKGAAFALSVSEPREYDIIDERQAYEEDGVGYVYLRRMIEACQSRGIDVLLVHLPYPASESDQMAANSIRYIAREYGVSYIDFVNLDQVVDYQTDMYDSFSHLNPSGARKVTDYLGRYISEHYRIPDRRADGRYAAWAEDYDRYAEFKLDIIRQQGELSAALMLLHDESYSAMISVKADSPVYADATLLRLMQNVGREHVYEEDAYSKWSDALYPLAWLDRAAAKGAAYFALVDRGAGAIEERAGQGTATIKTSFGEIVYSSGPEGASLSVGGKEVLPMGEDEADVRIVLIDNGTGEIAAVLSYSVP